MDAKTVDGYRRMLAGLGPEQCLEVLRKLELSDEEIGGLLYATREEMAGWCEHALEVDECLFCGPWAGQVFNARCSTCDCWRWHGEHDRRCLSCGHRAPPGNTSILIGGGERYASPVRGWP